MIGEDYALEYGQDRVEIHIDAISKGDHVLLVDDLIATGGTALAGIRLLERAGAKVIGCSFVIDLPELGGADSLRAAGKGDPWSRSRDIELKLYSNPLRPSPARRASSSMSWA